MYMKNLFASQELENQIVVFEFEGVYKDAEVYINDIKLRIDLTATLIFMSIALTT